jgi:hypothetical protein
MVHPATVALAAQVDVRLSELEQLPVGSLLLRGLTELAAVPLGAHGAVRAAALWARMTSHCQAQQMVATYEAMEGAERYLLCDGGHDAAELAGEELAALTHAGSGASIALAELTRYTGERLPHAWQALDRGDLSLEHVKRLARATRHAPPRITTAVDVRLVALAVARGWTPARLAAEATRAVLALDPDGAADRARKAKAAADVTLFPGTDETSSLVADGEAAVLGRVMDAIRARAAELARDAVGPLSAGLARFNALADLVLGQSQATRPKVQTLLSVDLATWLGLTRSPGELSGYGPISAETARVLSEDAELRLMLTDPVTGQALALGRTRYRPSEALRRFIHARDSHCQFPGCHAPAVRCDIDHIVEDRVGGPTDPDNLHCLCRRHHNLKTHRLWCLRTTGDGQTWTSPLGFTHHRRRERPVRLDPLEPPDIDLPPEHVDNAIPAGNPNPPPGEDDPLPEIPTLTLEDYLAYSDDLERAAFWAANEHYDTFYNSQLLAS